MKDFSNINWTKLDSLTSFFICSNSNEKLQTNDSINILFWGTLDKFNKITKSSFDSIAFNSLTSINYGNFSVNDTSLCHNIKTLLSKLSRNTVCYLKLQSDGVSEILLDKKLIVYFKENVDSIKANKWVDNIKRTSKIYDKTVYKSKDASKKELLENDKYVSELLENNPLPSYVEMYIKSEYFKQTILDSLKKSYKIEGIVDDVNFDSQSSINSITSFNELLKTPFIVKINTN